MLESRMMVANISPRGRRVRIGVAVVMLAAGAIGVALMWCAHLEPVFRLAYFPTFWLGALGAFQAWENTCVVLATKGRRETETGIEEVLDAGDLDVMRCQSHRVHLNSLLIAALFTALALALP
jgi:hypothetical protein